MEKKAVKAYPMEVWKRVVLTKLWEFGASSWKDDTMPRMRLSFIIGMIEDMFADLELNYEKKKRAYTSLRKHNKRDGAGSEKVPAGRRKHGHTEKH